MRATIAKGAVVLAVFMILAFLCLSAPAKAFWGDYGPEPPPEIFGVRLGDDIRNYKGMVWLPTSAVPPEGTYQRKTDEGLTFVGVPLWGKGTDSTPYYTTHKNKIDSVLFSVRPEDYEKSAQKMNAMFGPRRERRGFRGYVWMNSEVFVSSERNGSFYIRWLPIEKRLYGSYAEKWDKPTTLRGVDVTLGGRVADYPFLKEIDREGPDLIDYVSEKPLPEGLYNCIFSAYKGRIYAFTFVFKKRSGGWNLTRFLLGLPYDPNRFPHFFGDVQIDWLGFKEVYVQLTPTYWEANRARIAYYRNVKPD